MQIIVKDQPGFFWRDVCVSGLDFFTAGKSKNVDERNILQANFSLF